MSKVLVGVTGSVASIKLPKLVAELKVWMIHSFLHPPSMVFHLKLGDVNSYRHKGCTCVLCPWAAPVVNSCTPHARTTRTARETERAIVGLYELIL